MELFIRKGFFSLTVCDAEDTDNDNIGSNDNKKNGSIMNNKNTFVNFSVNFCESFSVLNRIYLRQFQKTIYRRHVF